VQYILLRRDSEKKKMAMLVQEITRRQNKFWNKVIEYTTFAMAAAMVAFVTWQIWMQYFVTRIINR
jgi:TRAP-type C4-dicarboxylate transport system permease small subunit